MSLWLHSIQMLNRTANFTQIVQKSSFIDWTWFLKAILWKWRSKQKYDIASICIYKKWIETSNFINLINTNRLQIKINWNVMIHKVIKRRMTWEFFWGFKIYSRANVNKQCLDFDTHKPIDSYSESVTACAP